MKKVRVAITMGDPAGIGPEVSVRALKLMGRMKTAAFFLIGDRGVLRSYGFKEFSNVTLVDLNNVPSKNFKPGFSNGVSGKASFEYLKKGVSFVLSGTADALVTAPIAKDSIVKAGFRWPGHTEFLAHAAAVKHVEMVFASSKLKTVVVTRHMSLRNVIRSVTKNRIIDCGSLMVGFLKKNFHIRNPKIAVCGLNPHAGENGLFGQEEQVCIVPAIEALNRREGRHFYGPFASDSIFKRALSGEFDLVMAMYHDQGLIPFKLISLNHGVHLTAGLPFIRTSPVHGTAFDIAGKNIADHRSMESAIRLACRLSR